MLQREILKDFDVKKVFSWQKPNGYLGTRFHTANSKMDEGAAEIGIQLLN